ncbi:glutamate ABC transporter substrate-binding protein [Nakamurella leprariae]|uniref:Glutamate ABC transporter substrate-binding protein n=1 Tax=Nakamurella leprariae TaxID=2803911 RepID=A0A938YGK9_9ACTN|nr:glutamate ABC transporter substrate-binding protein [Nakamurella leprariae]MBM9469213.1 glutamate ABC transporter substrate-binding protein [Nakamurella leprariae]
MRYRKLSTAVGVAAAAFVLAACGGGGSGSAVDATSTSSSAASSAAASSSAGSSSSGSATSSAAAGDSKVLSDADGGTLVVGIKYDQPGLGQQNPDGSFSGFDVEVAKYVAEQLGVPETGVTFKEAKSAEREGLIERGEVDLIVATYSITDARKEKVNFAGPYFVAHQDLLVRADNDTITGPESMGGAILCSVSGSTPAQKVKDNYAQDVALQEYGTYTECVEALRNGAVDAVTTDDVILAGYAAQFPGELKLVGNGFSDENYGIGLSKGDTAGTQAINDAIQAMIDDGSWAAALESTVGPSGYTIPEPPTPGDA